MANPGNTYTNLDGLVDELYNLFRVEDNEASFDFESAKELIQRYVDRIAIGTSQ